MPWYIALKLLHSQWLIKDKLKLKFMGAANDLVCVRVCVYTKRKVLYIALQLKAIHSTIHHIETVYMAVLILNPSNMYTAVNNK